MIFDKVISQYDEHNEAILFLIDKFNINKIIFIIDKAKADKIEKNEENYKKLFNNKEIVFEVNENNRVEIIEDILKKNDKAIINLSGGDRIISLLLLKLSMKLGMQSIYVDFINKRRYVFRDECTVIEGNFKDISLDEVFYLSGANIVNDSSELCDKKDVIEVSKMILLNINLWHKYKQRLYDNSIFNHNYKDTSTINIHTNKIDKNELSILNKCITYLKDINGIDAVISNDLINVKFKNDYLKGFLFKSGTWLEVITYLAAKSIKEVDEVKSGVLFSWSSDAKAVKNEIDVIAMKNSVLICISCKDSDKYDDDALNELSIYSERLGGKNVVKILVAAKAPEKISVIQRAKEMDINLIILERNTIDYLEKSLKTIINNRIK